MSTQRTHVALAFGFWLLFALLHLNAFFVAHVEGDEVVYLTLSREMNWDLTHYTTKDDPIVSQFPHNSYRLPLFTHPPLFPWLLKVGDTLGNSIATGLTIELLAMGLLFVFTARLMLRLLGWTAQTELRDGIERAYAWYRANQPVGKP